MGLKKPSTKLPTLSNPAVADEIFYNKEAIDQNGEVMTGTVVNVNSSTSLGTPSVSGTNLLLNSGTQENGLHINKGGNFGLLTALSNLGDASAANVLSGKTFTSSAGLKKTGTLVEKLSGRTYLGQYAIVGNQLAKYNANSNVYAAFSNLPTLQAGDIGISKTGDYILMSDGSDKLYAWSYTNCTIPNGTVFEFYR